MAKSQATKTSKTEETATSSFEFLRKGALAYVGLYGAAYEAAKTRFESTRKATDGLFDELVEKGENVEAAAVTFAKFAQFKATETFTTSSEKVRSVLPKASNDRVEELEAEITKLNKKIATMAKKKVTAKKAKTTRKAKASTTSKAA